MDDRREILSVAMGRMAQGDREALTTVYEMTSAKLFSTVIRIVRSREHAEDVIQDAYVKAWQRSARFDPDKGSPITWLTTIARNTALNAVRQLGRRDEVADGVLPEIADDTKPADEWLCDAADSAALHNCLEGLQDDHRRSIKSAFFDGLSHSELAQKLNVPLGTMKSWIRRGLSGLRGCLDG